MTESSPLPIAVIGAGFSGTMAALHLLPRLRDRAILLCERGPRFARGTAYGTDETCHLLNVRAANMSAYPDEPDHFVAWLRETSGSRSGEVHDTPAGIFVSRRLYGEYLAGLLGVAVKQPEGAKRLILVADEVEDLLPEQGGYRLVLAGGVTHAVAGAVLAVGNLVADNAPDSPVVTDPWSADFARDLRSGEPVVIIGSGLTMVDVALRLRHAGFEGPVIAISRRGLHPQTHAATQPWPMPTLAQPMQRSAAALLRHLRREIARADEAGVSWHGVLDGFRPHTSAIWQSLPPAVQDSVLRHARPWWDVHRHRTAPPVGEALEGMIQSGFLSVRAGTVLNVVEAGSSVSLHYRPRGSTERATVTAQRLIHASGNVTPQHCNAGIVRRLIDRGLARGDRHGLGLVQGEDLALLGADGGRAPGLWALGPIGTGTLWECVAVPDIRQQAARLAETVASGL